MRLFVGFRVSEAFIRFAQGCQNIFKEARADVKWVEPENLHVTVRFLGEVPEEDRMGWSRRLRQAASLTPPFELRLDRLGAFPSLQRPRVLWIGFGEGLGFLGDLSSHLGSETPYRGHLTLGRVRSLRGLRPLTQLLEKNKSLLEARLCSVPGMRVEKIWLIRSRLASHGPCYEEVEEVSLAGQP
ncbi:MAG: RNA 2',3'-cyclic phosphodiesterase [Elusimicrobia bacterium]|nr:RNA 2',3'-cyclic phosphodiesterase [Elusimicrobiota bacterium]